MCDLFDYVDFYRRGISTVVAAKEIANLQADAVNDAVPESRPLGDVKGPNDDALLNALKVLTNVTWIFTEIFVMRRTCLLLEVCSKNPQAKPAKQATASSPANPVAARSESQEMADEAQVKAEKVRANTDLESLQLVSRGYTRMRLWQCLKPSEIPRPATTLLASTSLFGTT